MTSKIGSSPNHIQVTDTEIDNHECIATDENA